MLNEQGQGLSNDYYRDMQDVDGGYPSMEQEEMMQTLEGQYKVAIDRLANEYHERLVRQADRLSIAAEEILHDDSLRVLAADTITMRFFRERLPELVEAAVLSEQEQEISNLIQNIVAKDTQLTDLNSEGTRAEMTRVQQRNDKLEADIGAMNDKMQSLVKTNAHIVDVLTKVYNKLTGPRDDVAVASLANEINNVLGSESIRRSVTLDASARANAVRNGGDAVRALNDELLTTKAQLDDTRKQKEKIENVLNQHEKNASSQDELVAKLEIERDKWSEKCGSLEREIQSLRTSSVSQQTMQDMFNRLKDVKDASEADASRLRLEIEEKSRALDKVTARADSLAAKLEDKTRSCEVSSSKLAQAEAKIDELLSDVTKYESQINRHKNTVTSLNDDLSRLKNRVSDLTDALESTRAKRLEVEDQLRQASRRADDAEHAYADVKSSLSHEYVSITEHQRLLDEQLRLMESKGYHECRETLAEFETAMKGQIEMKDLEHSRSIDKFKNEYEVTIKTLRDNLDQEKVRARDLESRMRQLPGEQGEPIVVTRLNNQVQEEVKKNIAMSQNIQLFKRKQAQISAVLGSIIMSNIMSIRRSQADIKKAVADRIAVAMTTIGNDIERRVTMMYEAMRKQAELQLNEQAMKFKKQMDDRESEMQAKIQATREKEDERSRLIREDCSRTLDARDTMHAKQLAQNDEEWSARMSRQQQTSDSIIKEIESSWQKKYDAIIKERDSTEHRHARDVEEEIKRVNQMHKNEMDGLEQNHARAIADVKSESDRRQQMESSRMAVTLAEKEAEIKSLKSAVEREKEQTKASDKDVNVKLDRAKSNGSKVYSELVRTIAKNLRINDSSIIDSITNSSITSTMYDDVCTLPITIDKVMTDAVTKITEPLRHEIDTLRINNSQFKVEYEKLSREMDVINKKNTALEQSNVNLTDSMRGHSMAVSTVQCFRDLLEITKSISSPSMNETLDILRENVNVILDERSYEECLIAVGKAKESSRMFANQVVQLSKAYDTIKTDYDALVGSSRSQLESVTIKAESDARARYELEISVLKRERDEMNTRHTKTVSDLESRISDLTDALNMANAKNNDIESKAIAKGEEQSRDIIVKLRNDLDSRQSQLQRMMADNRDLTMKLSDHESMLQELASVKTERDMIKSSISGYRKDVTTAKQTAANLQQQIDDLKEQLSNTHKIASDEKEQLERQIARLGEELEAERHKRSRAHARRVTNTLHGNRDDTDNTRKRKEFEMMIGQKNSELEALHERLGATLTSLTSTELDLASTRASRVLDVNAGQIPLASTKPRTTTRMPPTADVAYRGGAESVYFTPRSTLRTTDL